jgi:hypothetical protein
VFVADAGNGAIRKITLSGSVATVTTFAGSASANSMDGNANDARFSSPGGVAVLKARVRGDLRSHPAVLAYADAPPSAGGAGAVYVLLRRRP